jgi:hypothetical protein
MLNLQTNLSTALKYLMLIGITAMPACIWGTPPKPFSSEIMPSQAIAEITEIPDRPVWIRFLNSDIETVATLGKTLRFGESIRTEGKALAQITLGNGMVIRMEGNTILSIHDNYRLQLTKGRILAWVPANSNIQIGMNGAIASVKNATVYIDSAQNLQILNLQGNIQVSPTDVSKPIVLEAGQKLSVPKDNRDGGSMKPKMQSEAELKAQFNQTKLLSGFGSKLASQEAIAFNLKIPIGINANGGITIPKPRASRPVAEYSPPIYENSSESISRSSRRNSEVSAPKPVLKSGNDSVAPVSADFTPVDEPPQPAQPEEPKP